MNSIDETRKLVEERSYVAMIAYMTHIDTRAVITYLSQLECVRVYQDTQCP